MNTFIKNIIESKIALIEKELLANSKNFINLLMHYGIVDNIIIDSDYGLSLKMIDNAIYRFNTESECLEFIKNNLDKFVELLIIETYPQFEVR